MYRKTLMRFGDRGIMIETKKGDKAKHTPGQSTGLPRLEAGSSKGGKKQNAASHASMSLKKSISLRNACSIEIVQGHILVCRRCGSPVFLSFLGITF